MKKNDEFEIYIEDMGVGGEGIGKVEGTALFVKDAVIGDTVRARITKMKKTYGYARLMEVLSPSPYRAEPKCPIARQCGGCQLQALDYQKQLEFKQKKVLGNLERIGGFHNFKILEKADFPDILTQDNEALPPDSGERAEAALQPGWEEREAVMLPPDSEGGDGGKPENPPIFVDPIIGMENPWHYRNKAQFPVGRDKNGNLVAGFYAGHSHQIIPNRDCPIGAPANKEILDAVLGVMEQYKIEPYDETRGTGLVRHILIRCGFYTGEVMVCLVINGKKLPHAEAFIKKLKKIKGMTSITISSNTKQTNVIMGQTAETLWGKPYIIDTIGGISYQISPLSFYQVNPIQTEKLYRTALAYTGLTGEFPLKEEEPEPQTKKVKGTEPELQTEKVKGTEPELQTEKVKGTEPELQSEKVKETEPTLQTEKMKETEPALQTEKIKKSGGNCAASLDLTRKKRTVVWDLYCGIGTISLFLAQYADQVYGVEIVPQAIEDARRNAAANGIINAEFFVGKAEEILPSFYQQGQGTEEGGRAAEKDCYAGEENAGGEKNRVTDKSVGETEGKRTGETEGKSVGETEGKSVGATADEGAGKIADKKTGKTAMVDVIVVDPPRKGCDAALLETILKIQPQRIVYVSCDSATLARDLKILCTGGNYQLERVRVCDQFCQTVHVETVCLLGKRKPDTTVRIGIDMEDYHRIKAGGSK